MKQLINVILFITSVIFLGACNKNDLPNPDGTGGSGSNSSAYFFENTDWTGVANTYGQTYQQPFYLHFNGDTTVSVYALFSWVTSATDYTIVQYDSVVGKITNIDTETNSQTTISVTYPASNDQQIFHFQDKTNLSGGSIATSPATISAQYSFILQLNPATIPSVNGTSWNTDKMVNTGTTNGMYEFPDINGISFIENNKMTYFRNGKTTTYTPPTQDQLLIEGYKQEGPKIYFAGFNEEQDLLIQYFGVLSADGQSILADCRNRQYARLPNYTQTIYWYGSPGVTPVMHKAN